MILLVLLPLVAGLALRALAPLVAERCAPRWAAAGLTAAALAVALTSGFVLCALAGVGLAQAPAIARAGRWSADAIADRFAVSSTVAALAAALAAVLLAASGVHLVRAARSLSLAVRAGRALGPGHFGLVVVDDDRVGAYAIPVGGGRMIVSRRLLAALDGDERRALLAHEQAHLEHRHYLYVQLADLAAAANPLLRPVARSVHQVVESWADQDAVQATGDRTSVARAMAKTALLRAPAAPARARFATLNFDGTGDVAFRLRQLLEPRATRTGRYVVGLGALTVACLASAIVTGAYAHGVLETAQTVVAHRR